MRRGLTIGFRHGATEPEVIAGPAVPLQKQRDDFKAQRGNPQNANFARVTMFELDDTQSRSQRFAPVAVKAAEKPKTSDKSNPDTKSKKS